MESCFKYGANKIKKEGPKNVVQTREIYMGPRVVKLKNKV